MNKAAFSNKKKIRGWKRRVRMLDNFGIIEHPVNFKYFEEYEHIYVKCTIAPFYRLIKRGPPLWFFKLILKRLLDVFKNWDKAFTAHKTYYDLQLWLYDPHFILSEVVCKKVNAANDEYHYFELKEQQEEFPHKKFSDDPMRLKKLRWELCEEDITIDQNDIDGGLVKFQKPKKPNTQN